MKEVVKIYCSTKSPFEIRREALIEAARKMCTFCDSTMMGSPGVTLVERRAGPWAIWEHLEWSNEYCQASALHEMIRREEKREEQKESALS
jgi:hypothetical protein